MTLGTLPVGSRLLVRSKVDWRFAAVARSVEAKVVLTVASPSGHNYRLHRDPALPLSIEGSIPVLVADFADTWRENFSRYDARW